MRTLEVFTIKELKKKFNKRAHIEECKGNQEQNIKYCCKDNNYVEFGEKSKQGKRNDLKLLLENPKEIININKEYYIRYHKGIDKLIFEEDKKRINKFNEKLKVIVLLGQPGSGKTSKVMKEHGSENIFKIDSYEGQL